MRAAQRPKVSRVGPRRERSGKRIRRRAQVGSTAKLDGESRRYVARAESNPYVCFERCVRQDTTKYNARPFSILESNLDVSPMTRPNGFKPRSAVGLRDFGDDSCRSIGDNFNDYAWYWLLLSVDHFDDDHTRHVNVWIEAFHLREVQSSKAERDDWRRRRSTRNASEERREERRKQSFHVAVQRLAAQPRQPHARS